MDITGDESDGETDARDHRGTDLQLMTVASAAEAPGPIGQIKPMHLRTELVGDGRARCIVAAPEDEAGRRLAEEVAGAVAQAWGAAPEMVPAGEIDEATLQSTNVIALGLFSTNRVVERLYLRDFVLCDYSWPAGAGSYVIRTVHNPWPSGTNVVYLGAATEAGLARAADRFAEMVSASPQGALGPIIEVSGESLGRPR